MKITDPEVERLVYTSVDDLRVQIKYAKTNNPLDPKKVAQAYQLCLQHGYKTKAKLLKAAINRDEQLEAYLYAQRCLATQKRTIMNNITPETDAFCGFRSDWVEFAKKLERQRNEARALAEERKGYWEDSIEEYKELRLSYQKIYRERDEALAIIQEAKTKFCCDGSDGEIAAEMFHILSKFSSISSSLSSVVKP